MLGAAVAFRRAEHMRMTAIVANAKPAMRAYLDLVATCAALAFLLLVAWPAYEYASKKFHHTPALQIPNIWARGGVAGRHWPDGAVRVSAAGTGRRSQGGAGRVLSVAFADRQFWLAQPWLRPLGNFNLIVFFVGVAASASLPAWPIAFGFGLAIFGYLALTTRTPLMVLVAV